FSVVRNVEVERHVLSARWNRDQGTQQPLCAYWIPGSADAVIGVGMEGGIGGRAKERVVSYPIYGVCPSAVLTGPADGQGAYRCGIEVLREYQTGARRTGRLCAQQ